MILMELAADRANGGVVDFRPASAAFGSVCSTVFSRRALPAGKHVDIDWTRSIVMEARGGGGIVALALGASDDIHWRLDGKPSVLSLVQRGAGAWRDQVRGVLGGSQLGTTARRSPTSI